MPQLANLVLTDRAATPVNHTFTPLDIKDGVGVVVESSGVPIGDRRFSVSLTKTSQNRYKPSFRLTVPVVQEATVNGVTKPTVVRTAYADINLSFDPSSTEQERKDVVGMLQSSLDSTKWVNDVAIKLQGVY